MLAGTAADGGVLGDVACVCAGGSGLEDAVGGDGDWLGAELG